MTWPLGLLLRRAIVERADAPLIYFWAALGLVRSGSIVWVRLASGKMAAANMADQMALFNQYDSEYCTKATDVARKVQAVSSLGAGGAPSPSLSSSAEQKVNH